MSGGRVAVHPRRREEARAGLGLGLAGVAGIGEVALMGSPVVLGNFGRISLTCVNAEPGVGLADHRRWRCTLIIIGTSHIRGGIRGHE